MLLPVRQEIQLISCNFWSTEVELCGQDGFPPIHSILSDRRTSSWRICAVVAETDSVGAGEFVSSRPYCRCQVYRTVPPTEMQIIVANKKDRM
jgi:hypothetical protein